MRILKRTLYKFVAIIVFIPFVSGMANNDTHDKFDINARNNRELEDMIEEIVLECSDLPEVMAFITRCYCILYTIIILTIILTILTAHVTLTILFILSRSNCVRTCCRSLLCWCSGIFRIHLMDQSSIPSSRQQNLPECESNI